MTIGDGSEKQSPRLIGWKRIAGHLGCSERTARRWEAEERLPVHRQVHESKSTVFAYGEELDAWIQTRQLAGSSAPDPSSVTTVPISRQTGRRFWMAAASLVLLAGLSVGAFFLWNLPGKNVETGALTKLTDDPVALDLYQRGRALWHQRGEEGNRRAILLLEQAVEQDPHFAEAWSALASAWATFPNYADDLPISQTTSEALLAAHRALELDPTLSEPRTLMSEIAAERGEWLRAREIYEEAIRADPGNMTVLVWYAGFYRNVGQITKSLELTSRVLAVEPSSPTALSEHAMNTFFMRDKAEGEARLDQLWNEFGFQVSLIWYGKWSALVFREEFEAAIDWGQHCPFEAVCRLFDETARVLQTRDPARQGVLVSDIKSGYQEGLPGFLGVGLLELLGEVSEMTAVVNDEIDRTGTFVTPVALYSPRTPAFREGPDFTDIVTRIGLMDYWQAAGPPDFCAAEPDAHVCRQLLE